ncbi:MAG TPA: hypothetical protein H9694_04660 [Firmicutes bacterium]|nr:hypothetical protein [Bacillota bacterium]
MPSAAKAQNSMTVSLMLLDDSFEATAVIRCPAYADTSFSFSLNADLAVRSATDGEGPLSCVRTGTEKLEFTSPAQRVTVTGGRPLRELRIAYAGRVQFSFPERKNFHNIITPDIAMLSGYSAWFPQRLPVAVEEDRVLVKNGREWFVVQGAYDQAGDQWVYGGDTAFEPYNIAAYRREKLQCFSNPWLNIYFVDDRIREQAQRAERAYREIIEYYNGGLFREEAIPVLNIACASPAITAGGGYYRPGFMWCPTLGDDPLETAWLFAHETAHRWCSGADTSSWEDWLNETAAEWASLLFALHKGDTALFDYILRPKLENAPSLPAIRTADGSRPQGVHDKGTALWYGVYQQYGYETMCRLVRIFTDLPCKNTENFLAELERQGLRDAASLIRAGLDA